MTTPSLVKRLEALETTAPEHGVRVVHHYQDPDLAPEQLVAQLEAFLGGLPPHRGLTVVIKRFFSMEAGRPVGLVMTRTLNS